MCARVSLRMCTCGRARVHIYATTPKLIHLHLIVRSDGVHAGLGLVIDNWHRLSIHSGIHAHKLDAVVLKCNKPSIIALVVGVVVRGDGLAESDERPCHARSKKMK